jgi:hypothetical protein
MSTKSNLNEVIEDLTNSVTDLREAIDNRCWESVVSVYHQLSGENIELEEEPSSITPSQYDDVMRVIKELQTSIIDGGSNTERKSETPKKTAKKAKRATKKKTAKHTETTTIKDQPARVRENKFDSMTGLDREVRNQHGYDAIQDRNEEFVRQPRPAYRPVTATCTSCGKSEETNPILAKASYLCTRCQSRSGR